MIWEGRVSPPIYLLCEGMRYVKKDYLSIDVGGTETKYGILDRSGNIIYHSKVSTPKEELSSFLVIIDNLVQKYYDQIRGVAFSVPGRVNPITGEIGLGGALPYLDGVNLVDHLHNKFGKGLIVSVENDGKAAALAELWLGNLRNEKNCAAIVLGTGVGGGIILDGHLYCGSHYQAGELSFVAFKNGKDKYGNVGSAVLMINQIAKYYHLPDINDGLAVFDLINHRDKYAYKIFKKYCWKIANLILNIQAVLDLERYVIGGGISAQPIVADTIAAEYQKLLVKLDLTNIPRPAIMKAYFENNANLYGGVYNLLLQVNGELEEN